MATYHFYKEGGNLCENGVALSMNPLNNSMNNVLLMGTCKWGTSANFTCCHLRKNNTVCLIVLNKLNYLQAIHRESTKAE